MSRPARIMILCEDRQQYSFVRHFLMNRGCGPDDIRKPRRRSNGGSGEQYVREQFPVELKAYRSQANHQLGIGLVVVIDADRQKVVDRIRAFDVACDEHGVPRRRQDERVLYVIPKRNIETWLAYLRGETRGETVDEKKKFRKYDYPSDCHAEVDKLDAMCKAEKLDPVPPPSLERCCDEFKVFWRLVQ